MNPLLAGVGGLLGITPLNLNATNIVDSAAAGNPITLQALDINGNVVTPTDQCNTQADSFTLRNPAGLAIGGNTISGLGSTGQLASAGEANSIALGNAAATDPAAAGAIALGANATVGAGGTGGVALGTGAQANTPNSVALGAGSVTTRGPLAGYTALGLADPQSSAGEVSVGAAGAPRQITNVAAGTAPTDAVNAGQLAGVAAQVGVLANGAVLYDGAARDRVTLAGAAGTTIANVAPGALTPASTEAVNGAQLGTLGTGVAAALGGGTVYDPAANNLATSLNYGGGQYGSVQAALSAVDSQLAAEFNDSAVIYDGADRGTVTLAGPGGTTLTNVRAGAVTATSTDAVNGGQVYALAQNVANAVTYGTDAAGTRTNTVALSGGNAAAPVTVTNVAPAARAAGSTDAVNGGQLYTTNQAVTAAQTTASTALTLGQGSVQYDGPSRTSITLGGGGAAGGGAGGGGGGGAAAPVALRNVAAGTSPTDAVNLSQLSSGMASAVTQANAYTNQQLAAVSFDLRRVKRDANAGTAGALAAAGLPQAYEAGKGMIALAAGTYRGQSAFAFGFSKAMEDGHAVVKVAATYDTRGSAGGSAGMGWQF